MIKVVTSDEMRSMDHYTIEELGIPGVVLMENAGVGTSRIIQKILDDFSSPLVYIYCGKGNNGGDGYVIARYLWDKGSNVKVFIIGKKNDLRGDALINFNIIEKMGIPFYFISSGVTGAMTLELVPVERMGKWSGVIGLFRGLVTVPAPILGGLVWDHLDPVYVFLIPIAVDLLLKLPLLVTIPETLETRHTV